LALLVTGWCAAAPAAGVPTRGTLRVMVLLAAFSDRPLDHEPGYFGGTAEAVLDRFVAYYREVSSGRLEIVPTIALPAVTLPGTRASYVQRPEAIARDAVAAYAAVAHPVPPAADALVVFFAGPGRESHVAGGDLRDPWSNYTAVEPAVELPGGARFDEACVIAEEEVAPFSNFGVLCHEFGHLLGLPELYAPGAAMHEGIGIWGLMGQGTWLGLGEHPPHLEAWSKAKLGWVDVETIIASRRGVELPAVEESARVLRIPAAREHPEEYYLLENRARIGADAKLPGEGLLVWHVDERVLGFRSAESDPRRKLLHLVEADGRDDLDRGHAAAGNRGDATDPFRGPSPWRRRVAPFLAVVAAIFVASSVLRGARSHAGLAVLVRLLVAATFVAGASFLHRAPYCGPGTPGMAPYDGGPVRVVIRNLSPAGRVMRFDVLVAPQD
jgi:immune inhibitor A